MCDSQAPHEQLLCMIIGRHQREGWTVHMAELPLVDLRLA